MSKQILEQIQDVATQRKQEMDRLQGSPRDQLRLYNKIVAQVTRYQRKMCEVFGTPTVSAKPEVLLELRKRGDYLRWQDGLVSAEELRAIEVTFKGACILQSQEVRSLESEAVVIYHAQLNVDEHYFLQESLPSTKTLVMHDPVYTIYDFEIHVPRSELVKESLHAISRAMRRHKKSMQRGLKGSETALGTTLAPGVQQWMGIFTPDISSTPVNTTGAGAYNFFDNSATVSPLNSVLPSMASFAVNASSSANSLTY